MFYSEFEAVLDDVVGIQDFSGEEVNTAFIQIDESLKITGAVFFNVSFDGNGRVTGNWNIPLRHLLDHANFGPDLGAGPIKVACRSACPVDWHRRDLWDPDMTPGGTFQRMCVAVERNRLGIISERGKRVMRQATVDDFFKQPGVEPVAEQSPEPSVQGAVSSGSGPNFNRRYRLKLRAFRSAERLSLLTQAEKYQRQLDAQAEDFTHKLLDRENLIKLQKSRLTDLNISNKEMLEQIKSQLDLLDHQTEEIETLSAKGGEDHQQQIAILRAEYNDKFKRQLKDKTIELQEALHKREQELYQRSREVVDLRREFSVLREQSRGMILENDNKLLQVMSEKGVVFVAYHPGVEHLVIARDEMPDYLQDPISYVASRCEVPNGMYHEWLAHYHLPICRKRDDSGQYCGEPVTKVMRPVLFRPGETDRCEEHCESKLGI
jgi:hypothetical protein